MKRMQRGIASVCGLVLAASVTAGCGGSSGSSANGPIQYWLWDSAQQPGYQKCADAFRKDTGLRVNITQYGWNDYWQKVTSGFIADTAPDVFTNHLSKYAQYVDLKVLRPLDELEATRNIKDTDYQEGLAELWNGQDGHRYGTPKDWDTIAIFYNKKAVKDAGITEQQLNTMTWNPKDGGTFEKIVRRLTVDSKGHRGDEPGFDKNSVKTHGIASDGSGGAGGWGQTQWSAFSGSNGWQPTDKNPWGSKFNLDQKKFQDTVSWYFGLTRKGYMPTFDEIGGRSAIGGDKQVQTGLGAMAINGSWMISGFTSLKDAKGKAMDIGVAPTPIGPSGKRASMFNGLADSITTNSKQPENAAKWVAFLAGKKCQDIIGSSGVVFPARPSGTELAVKYNQEKRNLDVSAFTDHLKQKTTFLFPVTTNAADITAVTWPAFDGVYIGTEPASSLTDVNTQLNDLFQLTEK